MKQAVFSGAATALITPMYPDGSVNLEEMKRLVEWQIEQGIDALVAWRHHWRVCNPQPGRASAGDILRGGAGRLDGFRLLQAAEAMIRPSRGWLPPKKQPPSGRMR